MLIKEKGITLIALVITIIVLLILAGVSIAMLTGENGILTKANDASKATSEANALEKVSIAITSSIGKNGKIDLDQLINNLKNTEGKTNVGEEFPLNVTVDNYDFQISPDGTVLNVTGGQWTGNVNSPKLTSDMTPIYWDENGNEIPTTSDDSNWYNYEQKKWANAKTSDGSYFVWIPRYAYKITSGLYTSDAGTIEIKFLQGSSNKDSSGNIIPETYPNVTEDAMDDYVVHPAFINGTKNGYINGEWDCNVQGIWISKFEVSMEENGQPIETSDDTIGNKLINDITKVVSKPGVSSWRYVTPNTSYINSYNYDRKKESHMIKNSEWGAVSYLSFSKYGSDGNKILINSNENYYTGGDAGDGYKTNTAQSSTENIYGIYDLSGGALEATASYINNGNEYLYLYGNSFAESGSTKYLTQYPYDKEKDSYTDNYNKYKESKNTRYGDSILEISTAGGYYTGWFGEQSTYPYDNGPFFVRSGRTTYGNIAGVFGFNYSGGTSPVYNTYRICLAF